MFQANLGSGSRITSSLSEQTRPERHFAGLSSGFSVISRPHLRLFFFRSLGFRFHFFLGGLPCPGSIGRSR